jgi:hypothetical protein
VVVDVVVGSTVVVVVVGSRVVVLVVVVVGANVVVLVVVLVVVGATQLSQLVAICVIEPEPLEINTEPGRAQR